MITYNTLDKVTHALLMRDIAKALLAIEEEIELSKKKNQHSQVVKLRSILKKIADNASVGGNTASSYRNASTVNAKIENDLYEIGVTNTRLSEVILSSQNADTVKSIIHEWERKEDLLQLGLVPMNRIIIHGLPGTGKTKLANALATEIGYPIMTVHLDELMSSYLGKTGKNIREVFNVANKGNIILFLDEIDAIAKQRGDSQDIGELKRVVTVFLQNLDKLSSRTIVIGATNHDELLDRAIWRRFPVRIKLDLPSQDERRQIYELFLDGKANKLDINFLSIISDGLSGSAIEEVVSQILKRSLIDNKSPDMKDAVKAIFSQKPFVVTDSKKTHWKNEDYSLAQKLRNFGFTIREIESLTKIPYTTLKGHIK